MIRSCYAGSSWAPSLLGAAPFCCPDSVSGAVESGHDVVAGVPRSGRERAHRAGLGQRHREEQQRALHLRRAVGVVHACSSDAPLEERRTSARYLSVDERMQIADLRRDRLSVRETARRSTWDPATISRELRRNAHPGSGDYRPWAAQRRSASRRARPKPGKLTQNAALRAAVAEGMRRRWSPAQISRRRVATFPDLPKMRVSHETIYQALYVQGRGELRRELARYLRTGRAVRKPHRHPDRRTPRFHSPMLMISDRPPEVNDRAVPGHG